METFFVVIVCVASLLLLIAGRGSPSEGGHDEGRYISGADYDPVHYQVLRENVLDDR